VHPDERRRREHGECKPTEDARHLRVVARTTSDPQETPADITVPRGLPPWRAARWHLFNAAHLLWQEHVQARADSSEAEDFALAAEIADELFTCMAVRATDDRAVLKLMAHALRRGRRPKIAKSDAGRWLLETLPKTAAEARERYPDRPRAAGPMNLARWALNVLAAQGHADAGKILRRWGLTDIEHCLPSTKYAEDVETLASVIRLLLLEGDAPAAPFAGRLIAKTYRVVSLKRPFEAPKKKPRRKAADT
jgi:hypothetical protein